MSFQIYNGVQGEPPVPEKQKEGVVSFAYVSGTNDDISYLQLLGSNTIWVTGLSTLDPTNPDTLTLPSDANMIQLFDQNQVLVGCNKHVNLYVNAKCKLATTTPATIVLPVAGMYDLDLTVVSSTAVYVSCQQISGGPEATSGNLAAPLVITPAAALIAASEMIPPAGSCDLVLRLTVNSTTPTAAQLYTALYGTQTFSSGMCLTCKILLQGLGDITLVGGTNVLFSSLSPLGAPALGNSSTVLTNSALYLATFTFTDNSHCFVGGQAIGARA